MVVGRFAPSPTGPLHFGSLIAALASYCDTKSQQGLWLVRMEDLDQPRTQAGAADYILQQLQSFGLHWDSEVVYQSQRSDLYAKALQYLATLPVDDIVSDKITDDHSPQSIIYPCTCTRKEIADSSTLHSTLKHGIEGIIYPNICRTQPIKINTSSAMRIKTDGITIEFDDAIQGHVQQHLQHDIGDFVLKRADGLFAYQLAVVVDDAAQGITHVVRGADLLHSTPRQIYLHRLLGLQTPQYAHVPLAQNAQGEKLSKQTLAAPLNSEVASLQLVSALQFLGQNPPKTLINLSCSAILKWAVLHWQLAAVPKKMAYHHRCV